MVYHGADREVSIKDLQKVDVILTSYKVLQNLKRLITYTDVDVFRLSKWNIGRQQLEQK